MYVGHFEGALSIIFGVIFEVFFGGLVSKGFLFPSEAFLKTFWLLLGVRLHKCDLSSCHDVPRG